MRLLKGFLHAVQSSKTYRSFWTIRLGLRQPPTIFQKQGQNLELSVAREKGIIWHFWFPVACIIKWNPKYDFDFLVETTIM